MRKNKRFFFLGRYVRFFDRRKKKIGAMNPIHCSDLPFFFYYTNVYRAPRYWMQEKKKNSGRPRKLCLLKPKKKNTGEKKKGDKTTTVGREHQIFYSFFFVQMVKNKQN